MKYEGRGCGDRMVTVRPTSTPLRVLEGDLAGSMTGNLGRNAAAPLPDGTIGCLYRAETSLQTAILRLREAGVAAHNIHIGGTRQDRTQAVAQSTGVCPDLSSDDPLEGHGGYSPAEGARRVVDRAGLIGGAAGAALGGLLGLTPAGKLLPVSRPLEAMADVLFFAVVGVFAGSIVGASFAPQQSSHAGFRLIDGMQEGALAVVVHVPASNLEMVREILQATGASAITSL